MAVFQPPPTWASPVIVDEATGRASFHPVWLKWFVDLTGVLSSAGAAGGSIVHNDTTSKQGGLGTEFFHFTSSEHSQLRSGADTTLHFHASDRARANHTGTQVLTTISDVTMTAANLNSLDDGVNSTLHFHDSDRARANHTGTQEATTVLVARIGAPTYTTLQHYVNLSQSAGRISGGTLSNNAGNLDVAAGTGWVRIADDDTSDLKFFDWAASAGNVIPVSTTRYVGVEYNAGSPQIVIKTSDTWNEDTEFQLGEVSNEAGTLHIINNPFWVADSITNIIQRFSADKHVARDNLVGGLSLGETGTRNVTVSAGTIWSRLNDFDFSAFDSSAARTFDRYYRDGAGGFTREAAQTQWPNTQYDDGTGILATMTNNRYANLWFYAETDGDVVMLYGQAQYTSASAAEVESPPASVPTRLTSTGLLIGRIIFQKSAGTATTISSAFSTIFNPVAATDHDLLAGLDGGTVGEYFHLTSAEYTGTGTGVFVRATSPTLVTPTLNTVALVGGAWTAAATWTLPAYTLGGTVTLNGQSFSGTCANGGTFTTIDINGGTIDGTAIGGSSASSGAFTSVTGTGLIKSSSATAGVGYATGAGGTVTQATNKSTGVTLNTICGQITMNAAALAANTRVQFTLTNSAIAATDRVIAHRVSGGTAASYLVGVDSVAAGSCVLYLKNDTGGSLSEAVVIGFAVIKAVTA